jgi:hypothetical protein
MGCTKGKAKIRRSIRISTAYLVDGLVLGFEAQRLHGSLELLGVNGAAAIGVEQVERLANLLDLFLREAGALVGLGGALTGRLYK